jgi:hypothetical protein
MDDTYPTTPRTRLRRLPERGRYDKTLVHAILDEGFLCHLGFAAHGRPYVIPTAYARVEDRVYIHGSAASRTIEATSAAIDVCFTVTLVDGYVLARSAFHHSFNYRSVIAFGRAQPLTDPDEKMEALRRFTNHIVPGRWSEVRAPTAQELKATAVLVLPLDEVSAKVRTGPPRDDEGDIALPVWSGVVPVCLTVGAPEPDRLMPADVPAFDARRLRRG